MSKRVKKELLPFIVAIIMLFLLVGALIYTIMYKPKDNRSTNSENTLTAEDILVNNTSDVCGNYNITKLSEEAKKVNVTYSVLTDYNSGPYMVVDSSEAEEYENAIGYALRIKVTGLTDDMYIRVTNKTLNTTNDYYKSDIDSKGYVFDNDYNLELQLLDIKILINNDECKNIVLRNFETTLPRFNELLRGGICTTDDYKDLDICKPYIFDNDTYETQLDKIKKEKEKIDKEKGTKKTEYEKKEKNKKWIRIIIVASVLIVIAVASVVVMKGSKKHEKK